MSHTAAPSGMDERPMALIAPRRSRPSGRKNAHGGLGACRRAASGNSRSQALSASGKNRLSPTTARRSHLLPQSTSQKIKNWLCNAGNSAESEANNLSTAGLKIELGGAALTAMGIIGQPEVNPGADALVGGGVAAMLAGGSAGTIATIMQVGGGIAQMIGSGNSSVGANNAFAGAVSLLAGAGTAFASGGGSALASALAGTTSDTAVSAVPGMTPGQAQCGTN